MAYEVDISTCRYRKYELFSASGMKPRRSRLESCPCRHSLNLIRRIMQQAIIVKPSKYNSSTSEINDLLNDGYTVESVTANYIATGDTIEKEGGWLVILTKGAPKDC